MYNNFYTKLEGGYTRNKNSTDPFFEFNKIFNKNNPYQNIYANASLGLYLTKEQTFFIETNFGFMEKAYFHNLSIGMSF